VAVFEELDERRDAALVLRIVVRRRVTQTRAVARHEITDAVVAILNVAIVKHADHAALSCNGARRA
jgi:hypothetical protein